MSNKSKFEELLKFLEEQGSITPKEIKLIKEMRLEGSVNTEWLYRNYKESDSLEKDFSEEIMEEQGLDDFKPIVFGPYHALYSIGEGASGIVYKGWDIKNNKFVAMKKFNPKKISETSKQRFLREIEILKKLSHPNILPILDAGEENGNYFFITPFIEDGSLKQKIEELPLKRVWKDIASIFAILIEIGNALEYAHSKGIIHRDVKPANILLDKNHPYLADFGLARQIDEKSNLTKGAVGTPSYMAPELWKREAYPQTDVYSLAVIFYEVISGKYPYKGYTPEQILAQQLTTIPSPPVSSQDYLPLEINDIIIKALNKEPKKRHASVKEFINDIKNVLQKIL